MDELIKENENAIQEETVKEPPKLSIKSQFKTKKGRTRFITRVAMFSALSSIFYIWIHFPLPFLPFFLEINFSNLFIIIGSLLTGPVGGTIIIIVRFLIKMIAGTTTAYVGELTDVILSLAVMLPASITYLYNHNKKGGFIGIALSFVSWIVFSLLVNYFISLPFYLKFFYEGNVDTLIEALKPTLKNVNRDNFMKVYLFAGVLPFNLIAATVNCGLAFIVYKKISVVLKKLGL